MTFSPNHLATMPYQPNVGSVAVTAAETTTLQTVYTAGANGSKIIGIIITSNDTSNRDIEVNRVTSTPTTYQLYTVPVPLTAGTAAGVAAVNGMDPTYAKGLPVDNDGNPFIYLAIGDTLQVNAVATLTAAKAFNVTVFAEDF